MEVEDRIEEYRAEKYELESELANDELPVERRDEIRKRIADLLDWISYLRKYENK